MPRLTWASGEQYATPPTVPVSLTMYEVHTIDNISCMRHLVCTVLFRSTCRPSTHLLERKPRTFVPQSWIPWPKFCNYNASVYCVVYWVGGSSWRRPITHKIRQTKRDAPLEQRVIWIIVSQEYLKTNVTFLSLTHAFFWWPGERVWTIGIVSKYTRWAQRNAHVCASPSLSPLQLVWLTGKAAQGRVKCVLDM